MELDDAALALMEWQRKEAINLLRSLLLYGHHDLHCQSLPGRSLDECQCGYAELRQKVWQFIRCL